jgi:hypothetical protein
MNALIHPKTITVDGVGFLGAPSAAPYARYVVAVHQGLKEGLCRAPECG